MPARAGMVNWRLRADSVEWCYAKEQLRMGPKKGPEKWAISPFRRPETQ